MTEKKANFVPVSALDKRPPSKRELLRGYVVRIDAGAEKGHVAVGVVFTD